MTIYNGKRRIGTTTPAGNLASTMLVTTPHLLEWNCSTTLGGGGSAIFGFEFRFQFKL